MAETPAPTPAPWWKQLLAQPIVKRLAVQFCAAAMLVAAHHVTGLGGELLNELGQQLSQQAATMTLALDAGTGDGGAP